MRIVLVPPPRPGGRCGGLAIVERLCPIPHQRERRLTLERKVLRMCIGNGRREEGRRSAYGTAKGEKERCLDVFEPEWWLAGSC